MITPLFGNTYVDIPVSNQLQDLHQKLSESLAADFFTEVDLVTKTRRVYKTNACAVKYVKLT